MVLFKDTTQFEHTASSSESKPPDKSAYWKIIFLISQPKHMLRVCKRTFSMRRFF